MSTKTPPSTPTVAIARVLRDLGLTQGRGCDFRVTGEYRNGERVGTYVLLLTRQAKDVVAARADEIERLADESGFVFRVSVRYFDGKSRPMCTIANYGSRVRDTPPVVEEPPAAPDAPASEPTPTPAPQPEPAPEPEPAPSCPVTPGYLEGARERVRQQARANALGWSDRQAYLVASSATAALSYDNNGVLRDRPRPGWPGARVDEARLAPLVAAGFIVVTQPYGPTYTRVSITADGRDALYLWNVYRPTPVVKDRKEEREKLRPLVGGEEEERRGLAFAEANRKRQADMDVFYAALEKVHAWEERHDRMWAAWARVSDITYRLGRNVPAGWVPTQEEIDLHRLDPAVVATLRAEAAHPTARPEVPRPRAHRREELPPLPAVPDEQEQLSLFAAA